MLIDFYDIEQIVRPFLDKIDHAFLVDKKDDLMLNFLKENQFKYYEIENYSTAEDMSASFLEILKPDFQQFRNLKQIKIRIYETSDAWAESESEL
jgi:6-pyruvoyl-tetrahydropterin synthase